MQSGIGISEFQDPVVSQNRYHYLWQEIKNASKYSQHPTDTKNGRRKRFINNYSMYAIIIASKETVLKIESKIFRKQQYMKVNNNKY